MKIAIEGCLHGELQKVYETIKEIEDKENYKVDLLLCCGDIQVKRKKYIFLNISNFNHQNYYLLLGNKKCVRSKMHGCGERKVQGNGNLLQILFR